MKRRNLLVLAAVFAGMGYAHANNTSTITIQGKVQHRTCTVAPANSQTVQLPDMYTSDQESGWTDFSLAVTNCQHVKAVTLAFSGTSDDDQSDYWKNTGDAQNVMVEITKKASTIKVHNGFTDTFRDAGNGNVTDQTMEYSARTVKKTSGTPTAGSVQATVTVTYTYA